MRIYKYKIDKDQRFLSGARWAIPMGLHPSSDEELERRKSRKPLSEELKEKRRVHMVQLCNDGASYSLVGKLYKIDRSIVRKIVLGLPV